MHDTNEFRTAGETKLTFATFSDSHQQQRAFLSKPSQRHCTFLVAACKEVQLLARLDHTSSVPAPKKHMRGKLEIRLKEQRNYADGSVK